MSNSSHFFVLFTKSVSLDDAAKALRDTGISFTSADGVLAVMNNGVEIDIGLSTEAHVVEESRELSARLGVPEAARCDRRFEVMILDLDVALDEYTTLQAVQEALIGCTDGLVWLQWNDELFRV